MISAILSAVTVLSITLIPIVLAALFGVFGNINIPIFNDFAGYLISFWDFIFNLFGFARSVFLIGSFELNLILTILSIKLLYKPAISVIKMFIGWYNKLKL